MGFKPIPWKGRAKEDCAAWLYGEFQKTAMDRTSLERQWRDYLVQYRAPAKQPIKKFPYEGAANYMQPDTAIDVDQLFANELITIHAADNLWSTSPMNERWVKASKPMQDYLTWVDTNILKMFDVNSRVLLEKYKLGTAIYKTYWHYENRPIKTYDANGAIVTMDKVKARPVVDHVRLDDFFIPGYAWDVQPDNQGGAPWVAERLRISKYRLAWLAESQAPLFPDFDQAAIKRVLAYEEQNQTQFAARIHELDYTRSPTGVKPESFEKSITAGDYSGSSYGAAGVCEIELFEFHVRYPTGGTGSSEDDIVVLMHLPTQEIVRAMYEPYLFSGNGVRGYDVTRMFPGDGFYGIGVAEQKEMFQNLNSDLTNFMIDNVLLSNSRMIVVPEDSGIQDGEPIYPWKIWPVQGAVNEAFGVFPMADIYQSLPALIQMVQERGKVRTAVSDIALGNVESLPGRMPATSMMSLLQEGKKRPDLSIKMSRYQGLSNVGLRVVQLIQQFATTQMDGDGQRYLALAQNVLGAPEGQELVNQLVMPMENAELGLAVQLTATSASANKEVDRQAKLALLQLATSTAPVVVELAAQASQLALVSPAAAQMANASALGIVELFKRVLETYDVRDPEAIVPEGAGDATGAGGMLGGGGQGPGGLDPASLMAALSGAAGPAGGEGGPPAPQGPDV